MINPEVKKLLIKYSLIGVILIAVSFVLEAWADYNSVLFDKTTIADLIFLFGLILIFLVVTFAIIVASSGFALNEAQIERYEKQKVTVQKTLVLANAVLILCFLTRTWLPDDTLAGSWRTNIGWGALIIIGLCYAQKFRYLLLAKQAPELFDEREMESQGGHYINGFLWVQQGALLGWFLNSSGLMNFPVWHAFVLPLLIGYLGIHWHQLKELLDEQKPA